MGQNNHIISMVPNMQNATLPHFGGDNEKTEIKGLSPHYFMY